MDKELEENKIYVISLDEQRRNALSCKTRSNLYSNVSEYERIEDLPKHTEKPTAIILSLIGREDIL